MDTIKSLKRTIASLMITNGIAMLKSLIEFKPLIQGGGLIRNAIKGTGMANTELDISYAYISWEEWQEVLKCVYDYVVKLIKWEAEFADCDNRAEFVSGLVSMAFGLNTMGKVYCEVSDVATDKFKYLHWANVIVDKDGSAYLFDLDNNGLRTKITSPTVVMGSNKYKLISLRIG